MTLPFSLGFDAVQAGVSNGAASTVAKVEDPAKNSKRITAWIKSIGDLQKVCVFVHLPLF